MSQIDLVIQAIPPLPPSGTAQYARIDNTTNPVFSPAQTFTTVPYDLTPNGVDNGQYQVVVTPTYPDGRTCQAQTYTTAPCPNMTSVSAVQSGNNIVVTYTAPSTVPNVLIVINGPNGVYNPGPITNGTNNSQIVYPIPTGGYGDYTISMQTVCDATTGFFGPTSGPITITVAPPVVNPSLTGTVSIICGTNCGGQQDGGLQFNLTQVLSNDLTVQIAYTLQSPSGALEPIQQFGTSIIPSGYQQGTAVATGYATFVLPAGLLQINIPQSAIRFAPNPQIGGAAQPLICFCQSDSDYNTIYAIQLFIHPTTQPNITIQLTPTDTRISVIQV